MRSSNKFCQRMSNSNNNLFLALYIDEGKREDPKRQKRAVIAQQAKRHLNGGPILNAGLELLSFSREPGPVLLMNP